MAQGGAGEGEAAPIAFELTPEQGGSSWGRAWVHSLRQSQEGRKRKEGREGEKGGRENLQEQPHSRTHRQRRKRDRDAKYTGGKWVEEE